MFQTINIVSSKPHLFTFSFLTDGVILVDPEYLKDRKGMASSSFSTLFCLLNFLAFDITLFWCSNPSSPVFVTLTCAFRYGREDLDVLGLSFRKDLYISTFQAFPPIAEECKANSRLQERLLKKLGQQAHPFYFTVSQVDTHNHTHTHEHTYTLSL